jgi:threonine dehydrogenase-like Zn-dependent dehydrogenase
MVGPPHRSNRKKYLADKVFGHAMAGLFGYTHLTGGYPGGQAEYLVPFADTTHIKVPDGIPDEKLLFLSDIFPTGWQAAAQADIEPSDTVAIWGCGPVGQMTIPSAILLGAEHVMAIDNVPERLEMAEAGRRHHDQFRHGKRLRAPERLTDGKGPQKCIDCVGVEAHISPSMPDTVLDRAKQMVGLETDRPHVFREMVYCSVGRLGCCRSRGSTSASTTTFRWAC